MKINPLYFSSITNWLVHLWSITLKYQRHGFDNISGARNEHGVVVFAIWHDELFPLGYLHRNEGVVAVVSQSNDGEMIARLLAHFGFNLARGSSNRGGVKALINAYKHMKKEKLDSVFTVDGPTGPRHVVKDGVVYLATKARAPIIPVRVRMFRKKIFHKAWDKFQLPMPFSKIDVHYGEPVHIEGDTNELDMDEQKARVQHALDNLL